MKIDHLMKTTKELLIQELLQEEKINQKIKTH